MLLAVQCGALAVTLKHLQERARATAAESPATHFRWLWSHKPADLSPVDTTPAKPGSRLPWQQRANGAHARDSGSPKTTHGSETASDFVHSVISGGSTRTHSEWGLDGLYGHGQEHSIFARDKRWRYLDDLAPIAPMDWVGGGEKGLSSLRAPWDDAMYIAPYALPDPFPAEEPDRSYANGDVFHPKSGVANLKRGQPLKAIRHGHSGMCMSKDSSVATCDGSDDQKWEFVTPSNTVQNKVHGTCLTITPQPGGGGIEIGEGACHLRSTQQFSYTNGALKNKEIDQCLAVDNQRLITKDCSGKDDQTWQLEVKVVDQPCYQYTGVHDILHAPEDKLRAAEYPLFAPEDRFAGVPATAPEDRIALEYAKYLDQVVDKRRAMEVAQRKGCAVNDKMPTTTPPPPVGAAPGPAPFNIMSVAPAPAPAP